MVEWLYDVFHDYLSADFFASHLVNPQLILWGVAALKASLPMTIWFLQTVPMLLHLAVRPADIFIYNEEALKSLRAGYQRLFSCLLECQYLGPEGGA